MVSVLFGLRKLSEIALHSPWHVSVVPPLAFMSNLIVIFHLLFHLMNPHPCALNVSILRTTLNTSSSIRIIMNYIKKKATYIYLLISGGFECLSMVWAPHLPCCLSLMVLKVLSFGFLIGPGVMVI